MYHIESEFTHMTLQFGLLIPQGWRMDLVGITDPVEAYETMTRVAQEAEALGYDSIWLFDHFHTVPVPTQEVTFECWTSTAALARDTKRVRMGIAFLTPPNACAIYAREYRLSWQCGHRKRLCSRVNII